MVRAPLLRLAFAAGLGLACGCSSLSNCTGTSRLRSLFSTTSNTTEIGTCCEEPILPGPSACETGTCGPVLPPMPMGPVVPAVPAMPAAPTAPIAPVPAPYESSAPPLSLPRTLSPTTRSQPMPYVPGWN